MKPFGTSTKNAPPKGEADKYGLRRSGVVCHCGGQGISRRRRVGDLVVHVEGDGAAACTVRKGCYVVLEARREERKKEKRQAATGIRSARREFRWIAAAEVRLFHMGRALPLQGRYNINNINNNVNNSNAVAVVDVVAFFSAGFVLDTEPENRRKSAVHGGGRRIGTRPKKHASAGNRTRGPTMATLDFTTKPPMLVV